MLLKLVPVGIVAALVVPALAEGGGGATAQKSRSSCKPAGVTKVVRVGDDDAGNLYFKPKRVTIRRRDRIKWKWEGTLEHRVVGRGFHSKTRSAPYSYKKRFCKSTKRGKPLRIFCAIHSLSMRMRVRVKKRR
jgi:plastocyanin